MATLPVSTDRQISGLKPSTTRYEVVIASARGLALRINPSGLKQFEYRYVTDGGVRRRLVLGDYPDLSLAEARAKARGLRVSVQDGGDPAGERSAARERARTGATLDELAEAYWEAATVGLHGGRRRPKRDVTIRNERQMWKNHIQTPLGSRPFTEIRRADVKVFMRTLVTGGGLAAASIASIGAVLHAVLAFGVLEERLEMNPAAGLARPLALTSRDRMFDDVALRTIWDAAVLASQPRTPGEKTAGVHARLEPAMGLAVQLLMLTLTRRNEVAGARKTEFDRSAGLWIIPAERAKAKHQHIVPLSPESLSVLDQAWSLDPDSPFVFPSTRSSGQHLDAHAITRAFARTCSRKKLPLGSPHDVRRSGATTLTARYGVSRFIVGLVLGHTPDDGAAVTAVYDRHTYVPEKRDALLKWAGHLIGIARLDGESVREKLKPSGAALADSAHSLPSVALHVQEAKVRAGLLCDAGELHQAVLSMCMDMSRRPETATFHMEVLGQVGLSLASAGGREQVREWIEAFR